MEVKFDEQSDAMRITFLKGNYEISREVADGIIIDMTDDDKIMAIEILDVSQKMPANALKEIEKN